MSNCEGLTIILCNVISVVRLKIFLDLIDHYFDICWNDLAISNVYSNEYHFSLYNQHCFTLIICILGGNLRW